MRQGDLDVKRHGDDVGYQDKSDASCPGWEGTPDQEVAKEDPVARHKGDLRWPDPPCLAAAKPRRFAGQYMLPGEEIEIETSDAHDRVVGEALVRDESVRYDIPDECEVIVRGAN